MSADIFSQVRDFHVRFNLDYEGPPRFLDDDAFAFRRRMALEKLHEHLTAHQEGDLTGALAGITDLVYVLLGTAYQQGFDIEGALRRVHLANMRKVRVVDALASRRGSVRDVVKPPGWVPPQLADLADQTPCEAEGCKHGRRGPVGVECVRINCPGRTRR